MNRLPMEQREPTGPAMQSCDGSFQESHLKGNCTCYFRSLHLVVENSSSPRTQIEQRTYLLIAVSAPSIDNTSAVCLSRLIVGRTSPSVAQQEMAPLNHHSP